ncbi:hypothetical protein ZOSMA_5G01820 [Zostera marina]|uniref:Uncharacterized protein n=1 Tax=Zostera marina TaxID=29655 RepID=A0A0K9NWF8_ZOSMR|nr:hypothetical protein ZOSMA_5G01820 [Zostera marina]
MPIISHDAVGQTFAAPPPHIGASICLLAEIKPIIHQPVIIIFLSLHSGIFMGLSSTRRQMFMGFFDASSLCPG